jgi:hypothetical protein
MRRAIVLVLLVLAWRVPAQLPVTDVGNLAQNTIQAVQTVFMVANQILELTPFGGLVFDVATQDTLDTLADIVTEARGLSFDLTSLQAQITILFHLDSAPRSASDLQIRLAEIRRVVWDSYVYALRTQTLLTTTLFTVRRLRNLIELIGDLLGNMQGNHTLAQLEAKLVEALGKMDTHTTAYERAQSVERLTETLTIESVHRINVETMLDWPQ